MCIRDRDRITPAQPGNWTRRPDPRKRRSGPATPERVPQDKSRPEPERQESPDGREHIVNETA